VGISLNYSQAVLCENDDETTYKSSVAMNCNVKKNQPSKITIS
jgi:hypothetical protein